MLECALGTSGHLRLSRPLANALGESRSMLGCALRTSGPPTRYRDPPCNHLGESKPMLERASGNLWATSFETQTPFATAWGNEGECWMLLGTSQPLGVRANQNQCLNAFGNRWATTSDIETPCNRLGDQHQCRGALWEPLGHQLRYPDSLCSRWGESKSMLECALEPLGHQLRY